MNKLKEIKGIYEKQGFLEYLDNPTYITEWHVNKEYRKQGIGSKLLKKLIKKKDIINAWCLSKKSLGILYRNGFRPRNKKKINYQELLKMFKQNDNSLMMRYKK